MKNQRKISKSVDASTQPLSKEFKQEPPIIHNPNRAPDIIPPPLTQEEKEKFEKIADDLTNKD